MKKTKLLGSLILTLAIVSGIYAFGIDNNPPQKVKDAFAQKFPDIKKVEWEKESDTKWEAEFKMNGKEYSASFLEDGTWQETEYEIKKRDIANIIKAVLLKEFPDYSVEEAEISETAEGKFYEFEIEKGENEMEVTIDKEGKIVKKEMEDDSEDENDDN